MIDFIAEPVTVASAADVVPLLAMQLSEHGMPQDDRVLQDAVRGLVSRVDRGAILVAKRQDEAIGVAVLSYIWTLEHGGLSAWLDELYVLPLLRGRGVGTKLLGCAIARAQADGCRALDLEVDQDHARVERLYERSGFLRLPRRRFSLRWSPFGASSTGALADP